ncbi:MAG: c-type cytochrome [Leptospirales bacterium]
MKILRGVALSLPLLFLAVPAWAANAPDVKSLIQQNGCMSCHLLSHKLVGPSYEQIAQRYDGKAGAQSMLAKKIITGGNGHWNDLTGGMAMPPHPDMTSVEANAIAAWVLSQKQK